MSQDKTQLPDGAHTRFEGQMSYGDYLALDQLLNAQRPRSKSHDETLFIIQHQTTELWIKLILHELDAAIAQIRAGELSAAFKMLARISRVQHQLVSAWDVLSTMTPADYMTFREQLGHASGFQSFQYRLLEYKLGNKNAGMLSPHGHRPDVYRTLESALKAPSLYDEAVMLLSRRGFTIAAERLSRDWTQPAPSDPSVKQAWIEIYRDPRRYWDLYELAEELVDLEDGFVQWRFRHVVTVERIIGGKKGTGGTAGVSYLKKAVEIRLFPELWELRTEL
ncbi:MAG: tryptophan 2,3-dioxygenase [Elusimicrobia bacterium]|nr:tryptophan 2,3-dioxygenase [Elusimicrobiota bacterium]